ncbi:hypothetical protein BIZ37_21445 [Photobacterium sp. BZF1]|uniref:hypothetical protein n=1 Tax=Photobacterium TaxID=657 RepID=UPI001653C929|nr:MULTISPECIES: hypothetical protein [Photobacterium]MBC7005135.1 hypothetical protein [Photobacterium sp. BZF1]MBY5944143.1 hypothetical protein [Photobacterium rosenbergii]
MNSYQQLINRAKASIGIIGFVVVFCFASTLQLRLDDSGLPASTVPEWQRTSSAPMDSGSETGVCSLGEKLIRYQVFSSEGADPPLILFTHFDIEWLPAPVAYFYRYFEEYIFFKTRLHLRHCCFLE